TPGSSAARRTSGKRKRCFRSSSRKNKAEESSMLGTYHLSVLYDVLKDLHFLYQSDRIYSYLLENLLKAADADAATLYISDEKRENLIPRACLGPKKQMIEMIAQEIPFPFGKGLCGWCAR